MIISVTGHRPNKLGFEFSHEGPVSLFVREKLQVLVKNLKPTKMISGMALGVDTIWAMIAIKNNIPLIAAIPFKGQEKIWPKPAQDRYHKILSHKNVKTVVVSDGGYSPDKMQKRNEWMVDNSDIVICVWDGSSGGTANCVRYAKQHDKEVIRINPMEYSNA